jgi:hypothetical protein
MAIRIVQGPPGSGKTYFAVHHILHKYFDFDPLICEWHKKPEFEALVLISNIDGLPYTLSLDSLIESAGSMESFFTYEYQDRFANGRPVIYLLDEAQALFPYTYRDTRVFLFFQKHRHLGMDIYLLTQDVDLLAKGLRSLAEFHIVAVRRSLSLMGELRYKYVDPTTRECWRTQSLRKDGTVFAFYRSFSSIETEKSPSVPRKYVFLFIASFAAVLCIIYFGFWRRYRYPAVAKATVGLESVKVAVVPVVTTSSPVIPAGRPLLPGTSGSVAPALVVPGVLGKLVGMFVLDSKKLFLVQVPGGSVRVSEDVITNLCRCHADDVRVGDTFELVPGLVPRTLSYLFVTTAPRAAPASNMPGRAGGGG